MGGQVNWGSFPIPDNRFRSKRTNMSFNDNNWVFYGVWLLVESPYHQGIQTSVNGLLVPYLGAGTIHENQSACRENLVFLIVFWID